MRHTDPHKIYQTLKNYYGPQHWWPAKTPFEVAVGAILTQNTAWINVEQAIKNLRAGQLLSFQSMRKASLAQLKKAIRPAGFFNIKAGRLRYFLSFLEKTCGGNLLKLFKEKQGDLREKLLAVKGIGPETADSILLYAGHKKIFVVDAYTRRIFSRIGCFKNSLTYGQIQTFFLKNLPSSAQLFNEYHALIVEHAKRFCRTKPACGACPLRAGCAFGQNN